MTIEITEITIHPFTIDEDENWFNTYEEGLDDSDITGWHVHAFGTRNSELTAFDEADFDDFDSAWIYAEALATKYGTKIDRRW